MNEAALRMLMVGGVSPAGDEAHRMKADLLADLTERLSGTRGRIKLIEHRKPASSLTAPFLELARESLAVAEDVVSKLDAGMSWDAFFEIWKLALCALVSAEQTLGSAVGGTGGVKHAQRETAWKMHAETPVGKAKVEVREWWDRWQKDKGMYPSIADFARAMCDKHPVITDVKTVRRWHETWIKGRKR